MLKIDPNLKKKLDIFYKTQKIPNIIFHGSSGCGKKTIVKQFIQTIYNNNMKIINENVMFINCSQGKGIKFIREELKTFAKYNIHVSNDVPFKTIVLLNADALTIDAQSALRRCIEIFINTRFFIIVENKHKLLNPIISRFCSIYVPEHIDGNGEPINLHQYQLGLVGGGDAVSGGHDSLKGLVLHPPSVGVDANMDMVGRLYEDGVSCIDLIEMIRKSDGVDEVKKSKLIMDYYIFKREYRCEKLLMFHVLSLLAVV